MMGWIVVVVGRLKCDKSVNSCDGKHLMTERYRIDLQTGKLTMTGKAKTSNAVQTTITCS
jgi:hypothetical protein